MLSSAQQNTVQALGQHVQQHMPPDPTGHDWPHVQRVLRNAQEINRHEGGDLFLVSLVALTHDLYDHKFFKGSTAEAETALFDLLCAKGVDRYMAGVTVSNVFSLSFSKGVSSQQLSPEGRIVQDADRLEAIGAIGIARAFAYGGFKQRLMNRTGSVAPGEGTTFDHFFEKLLRLYDLLNTPTAREMARARFAFMQEFVKRFEAEWNGSAG